MKKVSKSPGPNALTRYAEAKPGDQWQHFYDSRDDYAAIKKQVFKDQGGLCAYCEARPNLAVQQRMEHIHPKSDISKPEKNWALDWYNIIGVCQGGSDYESATHARPANLSCDAYKDHIIKEKKLPPDCGGWLLNPLHLPAAPCLFEFDLRTYELKPNRSHCEQFVLDNDKDMFILVSKTIEFLNLNCDRLKDQRKEVLNQYNREVKLARGRQESHQIFQSKLVENWFRERWPKFFTTRRILLGSTADAYLAALDAD